MPTFYVTFGQKSPFRDGYVEIEADDQRIAQVEAFRIFGQYWSEVYEEDKIKKEFFHAGRIGIKIKLPKGYNPLQQC